MTSKRSERRQPAAGPGLWLSVLAVALFFGGWELLCRLELVSPVLLSSPSRIAAAAPGLLVRPLIQGDMLYTLRVFALSLLLGTLLGTAIGAALGVSRAAYRVLNPFIVAFNALPKIVLMPLVVLWAGIGAPAGVALGTLMASFPVIASTYGGVRALERDYVLLARAFGAGRLMTARAIVLPGVLPYSLSGLRVGINYAMVGALISEFFAASRGVGYRMMLYMSNFQVDGFFVCLVLVVVFTLACTGLLHLFERRVSAWRPAAFEAPRGL